MKSSVSFREVQRLAKGQQVPSRLCSHLKHGDVTGNNAKVKDYARTILSQKIEVLNMISNEDYTRRVLLSSTIGAHMRHSLDHFNVVLRANSTNSVLDYDSRERNTDTELVRLNALQTCDNFLIKLRESNFDDPVTVKFISDPATGKKLCLPSDKT